jgi:exopolysaccharide biosynthesis polyprenyl glycosylphosphotransferase
MIEPGTHTPLSTPSARTGPAVAGPRADAPPLVAATRPPTTRPSWERRYARWLPAVDLLQLLLAALVIQLVDAALHVPVAATVHPLLAVGLSLAWLVSLAAGGSYESRVLGQGSDEYKRLLTSSWHFVGLLAVGSYALDLGPIRGFLFAQAPLGVVAMLAGRQMVRRKVWARRRLGFALHRVVVVGPPLVAAELIREINGRSDTGFAVVGVCTSGLVFDGVSEDIGFVGDFENVLDTVVRSRADTVAVVGSADMPTGFIRKLAWQLEDTGVDLMVSPAITDVAGPRIHVRPVANISLLYVEAPQFSGATRVLKNSFDRLGALALLVLLSPLMLAIAAAVKLTSPGPVLFRQTRIGYGGEQFTIWKFRTMHADAEHLLAELKQRNESDGSLFKIRRDPRITPMGRALRRFSLDELPQLFNVVSGRMSLVGPRPLPVDLHGIEATERRRLLVKPGMTGLWQINGRSDLNWEETVRLDLYYVENWSLAADFVILLRTLAVVLRGEGAY